MFKAKAYSASSATSPLALDSIQRREAGQGDYNRNTVLRHLPLRPAYGA